MEKKFTDNEIQDGIHSIDYLTFRSIESPLEPIIWDVDSIKQSKLEELAIKANSGYSPTQDQIQLVLKSDILPEEHKNLLLGMYLNLDEYKGKPHYFNDLPWDDIPKHFDRVPKGLVASMTPYEQRQYLPHLDNQMKPLNRILGLDHKYINLNNIYKLVHFDYNHNIFNVTKIEFINEHHRGNIEDIIPLKNDLTDKSVLRFNDEKVLYQIRNLLIQPAEKLNASEFAIKTSLTDLQVQLVALYPPGSSDKIINIEDFDEIISKNKVSIDNTHKQTYFSSQEQYNIVQTVLNPAVDQQHQTRFMEEILSLKKEGLTLHADSKEFILDKFAIKHPEETTMILQLMNDKDPVQSIKTFITEKQQQSQETIRETQNNQNSQNTFNFNKQQNI